MNTKRINYFIVTFMALSFFSNPFVLAVEPTTFPTNKPQPRYPGNLSKTENSVKEAPKAYPGEIWKSEDEMKKETKKKTKKERNPQSYPGSIWKTDKDSKKSVKRKNVKESGGMIDPEIGD